MSAGTAISIVTPCYNGARFLRETIESVLKQTRPPLEMIVVDDGSTDDSAAIAESYGPPVRVIRQKNQGESVARNRGIAEAKGDYLLFLDADDMLAPEALERLAEAAGAAPGAVVLMGSASFEHSPHDPLHMAIPEYDGFFPAIIHENPGVPHCWLTPKSLVEEAGRFPADSQLFEDWDLWAQIALTGARLVCIPFVGALYRRHRACQSATSHAADRARGFAHVMERLGRGMLARPDLLEKYAVDMFWGAWTALHRCREKGVPWSQLRDLRAVIRELIRRGPPSVRRIRFAQAIRVLGVPLAETLRNVTIRTGDAEEVAAGAR